MQSGNKASKRNLAYTYDDASCPMVLFQSLTAPHLRSNFSTAFTENMKKVSHENYVQ